MAERRRRPTATSAFGVSKREGHDSSAFYARFVPPEISTDDAVNEPKVIDEIFVGDSRAMTDVADASVALVVTSPPYFAGKEYEAALGEGHVPGSYIEYLQMLEDASLARGGQSDLFVSAQAQPEAEAPADALREALDQMNPDELTPREALEMLYRLKKL